MSSQILGRQACVRRLLLATTAVAAMQSLGSLAHAQQTVAPTSPGPASATPTSPPAPQTASPPATQLNEVVVTAERRETNLQRTAAALEVLGAPALQRQRVVEFTDLNSVLNNTQILPANLATQVNIRGIGSNFVDSRADPGVAISINGLFYTRPLPVGFGFLDVSRVEVLEGPQGTLYGRNSAAGAINIITNQPTQTFGGMVQASFGNLNERDFTGVLNVPVTDTLAVRVAYDRDMRDGYISDYYDDKDSTTGRISARWTPTNKLTVYVESDYLKLGGHGNAPESYPCPGSQAWVAVVPAGVRSVRARRRIRIRRPGEDLRRVRLGPPGLQPGFCDPDFDHRLRRHPRAAGLSQRFAVQGRLSHRQHRLFRGNPAGGA